MYIYIYVCIYIYIYTYICIYIEIDRSHKIADRLGLHHLPDSQTVFETYLTCLLTLCFAQIPSNMQN